MFCKTNFLNISNLPQELPKNTENTSIPLILEKSIAVITSIIFGTGGHIFDQHISYISLEAMMKLFSKKEKILNF